MWKLEMLQHAILWSDPSISLELFVQAGRPMVCEQEWKWHIELLQRLSCCKITWVQPPKWKIANLECSVHFSRGLCPSSETHGLWAGVKMAHRIANNGMRNFTHHQPLSVLQAFAHCHHTAGAAPPSLEARPVTGPRTPPLPAPGPLSSRAFARF